MVETHARSIRDLRVDFFRGISLYMILVDHVVGDPIARLTYQNLGFSDAAEAFIFLSGLSCGIVYSRVLMRRGWAGLTITISKRAAQIYAYYLLSSIALILILNSIKNTVVSSHPFIVLREEPISAILSTIFWPRHRSCREFW